MEIITIIYNFKEENSSIFLNFLVNEKNLTKIFKITFHKNEGIVYSALDLIFLYLENDEIFWMITEDVDLIQRIYDLISLNNLNLPESIEFICVKFLTRFMEFNKENEEFIEEVKYFLYYFLTFLL